MHAAEATHPRLFFSAGEIPALREKIKREPHSAMFQAMKADGEKLLAAAAGSYDQSDPQLDIRKAAPGVPYALWTVYASCVWIGNALAHPDFGDDNAGVSGEGSFGLAFYYATDALKPGLKYWYDRTIGSKGVKDYDSHRGSRLYSILYYPADLAEKQPMEIPEWREAFVDTGGNGLFTYRNTYTPHESIVAQIYAKLRGDKGHSGSDALSFRILGLDTAWAVGGGRYGPKTGGQNVYFRSMNTLYPIDPDGKLAINGNSGRIVGTPVSKPDGSGSVVMSISENNVGTKEHKRSFLTDFSKKAGVDAVCVIADKSANGKFWQMVTVEGNAVATSANTFTIQGAGGATLRGTVVYPTGDLGWKTGKRIRGSNFIGDIDENNFVHFQTPDGKALVVLTVARRGQQHPAVIGNEQALRVGGAAYRVADESIE